MQDIEDLMGFYQRGRNEGGNFDHGIEMAIQAILMDPDFIFRKELEPANLTAGKKYRISDLELANRLSFFLWSSIPDETLLTLATQHKLSQPAVLEQQVRRMLADSRSDNSSSNFAGQWLNSAVLQSAAPVTQEFPDFDDNLRNAFQKEANSSLPASSTKIAACSICINADYTFVNERLAKHYGIPNVYGSDFRRVKLGPGSRYAPRPARQGLLWRSPRSRPGPRPCRGQGRHADFPRRQPARPAARCRHQARLHR